MRLVIDIDDRYKKLFYGLANITGAAIVDEEGDFWGGLPEHVKTRIENSFEQVKNDHTMPYDEVKKMLAYL